VKRSIVLSLQSCITLSLNGSHWFSFLKQQQQQQHHQQQQQQQQQQQKQREQHHMHGQ